MALCVPFDNGRVACAGVQRPADATAAPEAAANDAATAANSAEERRIGPVPTAKSKRLTATANRLILAADERPLQIDLVRLDRTVLAAGCVASRDPCPSTSTQRAAAQIPEAIGVR